MKKKALSLFLTAAMVLTMTASPVFAADDAQDSISVGASGLCEHHTEHTADCGYTEGSEGTPCSHEHTEECYTLVTECVHEHGPECYPEESVETAEAESVSGNTATPSEPEEQEPSACTHVCIEESDCTTKKLDCQHEHNEACGYAPATEGTPCGYVCEICNPQDSSEVEETEPEAECICTGLCTEETVNAECPVCGIEGADLTACEGVEAEIATLSNALAVETKETAGAFEVTGDSSSYSYNEGVLTVNDGADITISMASGATTPTSDRIVVNGNAEITLSGVNITAPSYGAATGNAQSAIDVSENAHLILNLSDNDNNTLTGGSGGTDLGAPGIHVPESSSLVIQGSGNLSVTGGNSTNTYGGSGIGGKPNSGEAGEACGTVIILATGNVTVTGGTSSPASSGGADIGGGLGTTDGGNGQGIRPGTDGTYTVYGDLELPCDIAIPEGTTVVIPEGASLTVPQGTTLTNNGTILVQGGEIEGTVSGNPPTYPSKVTVSFSQDGKSVASVPYGSTVTITATMEKAKTAANALSANAGKVDFYLGDANDTTGMKMGIGTVEFEGGAYTASVDVTIGQDKGFNNAGTFKFTADFGGYAPEGDERGDSLAPATGSAELTVTKAEQTAPSAPTVSTTTPPTANSITLDAITTTGQGDVQYGYSTEGGSASNISNWQTDTTFDDLDPGTTYTFYARYAGNDCYEPSPASAGTPGTTLRADSTLKVEPDEDTLTYGETLTITVTPEQTAANGINTQTAQNAVELKKGDTVLASTTTANSDGSYTLTYNTQQKGLTSGTNTLTVSYGGSGNLNASTATVDITLSKKDVTPALDGTFSKTYDGTTNAPEGLTLALIGVLKGDDVTATGTVAYNTDDVGTGKTITANNIELTGDDAVYYILMHQTVTNNGGEITVAALSGTLAITGTAQCGQQLTASYDPVHDDEQVSYQWNRDGQPITGATSDTYTLTAEDIDKTITVIATATDSNHTGSVTSAPVTVGKASGSGNSGGSSSGGSGSSYRDREYEFWMEVRDEIRHADPGDTIKANAKGYDRMPWSVMEALRKAEGVTLHITWNGGEDIIIPSEAALAEQSRVYYPLSYLEDMTFEVESEAPAYDPGKVNPETGGILEVTAPAAADSLTDPVTDPQRGLAETPELAEQGIEQPLPGIYEPAEALAATPAEETGTSGLLIAGIALVLAAAGGSFWYWKRRKQV